MKTVNYKTDWLEVTAGILFLAYAVSIRFDPSHAYFLPTTVYVLIFLFGIGAVYIVHVFIRYRFLYYLFVIQVGVVYGILILWSALHQEFAAVLFHVLVAAGVLMSLVRREGIFRKTEKRDIAHDGGRNAVALVAGSFLALLGASVSLYTLFPDWFRFLDAYNSGGKPFYPFLAIGTALIGGGLLASELHGWKGYRKHVINFAAFLTLALVAFGNLKTGTGEAGLVIGLFAVIFFLSSYWNFVSVFPRGIDDASQENMLIFGYEYAGKIGLWSTTAWTGVYFVFVDGLNTDLFFFGIVVATVIGIVSYHLVPIKYYSYQKYFITLIGLIASFALIVIATGGLESPFLPFGLLLVFAGTLLPSKLVWFPAVIVFSIPLLDFAGEYLTLGYISAARVSHFAFSSAAIITAALFTVIVSKRREVNEERLIETNKELEKTLLSSEKTKEYSELQAERFKKANEELIEMRAALMNVLEDVEVSKRTIEIDHLREKAIFQALGEGVIATDKPGNIILFNRVASEITGIPQEEVAGKRLEQALMLYEEDKDVIKTEPFVKALEGVGSSLPKDVVIRARDGRHVPVAGTVQPYLDDEEQPSGIVVAFRDITIQKEIDEQKSGFISVASHQLRTPLSAMRWYVDLLLAGDAGKLTKQQTEFLSDVHASIQRLASLVDDLLNVSRAESGRLIYSPKETDMRALIEQLIKEMAGASKEKKQKLDVEFADDLPSAIVDPKLFAQVIDNLIGNAIKYTPEGGKVGVRLTRKGEDQLLLEIWDTGFGIAKENQHKIFQKFYRGKRAVSMETVGTGLGLYIAKTIVDGSGGKIWFESEEGKGTKFFVVLPVFKGKGKL